MQAQQASDRVGTRFAIDHGQMLLLHKASRRILDEICILQPSDHTSTLDEILTTVSAVDSKHSGGKYQYVPAPWLVKSVSAMNPLLAF